MQENEMDKAIGRVADEINRKRRQELLNVYNNSDIFKQLNDIRQSGDFDKGNKSKSMRKVAHLPEEVDLFFIKIYGDNYFKDPDFFTKYFKEWTVVDPKKL